MEEDARRPCVADDVVHRYEQQVFCWSKAQHLCAQDRPGAEIKRTRGFMLYQFCHLILLQIAQVHNREFNAYSLGNDLTQCPIDESEVCPQRLVTSDYFVEAL